MPRVRSAIASAALTVLVLASPAAAMTARGSVGEAYVLGAKRGERLVLVDRRGHTSASGRADRLGSRIFRDVRPAAGYRVRGAGHATSAFRVLRRDENPPAASYRGHPLHAGLNYVRMRDGVELAMTVRLPAGKKLSDGPFPTLLEISGYQTAAPHDLLSSVAASLTGGHPKPDPLVPATSTAVGSLIAQQLGFAAVSVQMRGSGCSGGDFDLFGLPTTYDGYDAVEAVAAQSWVKGGKVGLAGISFSGISQLFAAGTRPPHLAAISPMSVTDDLYSGTTFPGGILNSGFASSWVKEREADARPAPAGGQPYARALTRSGDKHCLANQRLRLQTQNATRILHTEPFRTPSRYEARSPAAWMARIQVPTFLVGQFEDEQTSGHFARSLGALSRNRKVWITLANGVHADSLGPDVITRWAEFLQIYVGNQVPRVPDGVLALSSQLYRFLADAPATKVNQSRLVGLPNVASARAVFERDPRVRVLMDNGGGPAGVGALGAAWELGFDAWPVRQAKATSFFLGGGGALSRTPPASAGSASYVGDPRARPRKTLPGDGAEDAWKAQPPYRWAPVAAGKGLGFTSPALTDDVVVVGSSSLDLTLRSSARDTDLQVTLTEVRPDGQETYVQNGWLRASHRALDAGSSTALDPVPTHLEGDSRLLPKDGSSVQVRVPLFPAGHAFRKGSRIRVTITAPGGDRPRWEFATLEHGTTRNTISLGGARPSKLVLPVVTGATAKGTPLPAPTALRGEPNRAYAKASNGG